MVKLPYGVVEIAFRNENLIFSGVDKINSKLFKKRYD